MIVSDLEHIAEQLPAWPALHKAIAWLRANRGTSLPDGRIAIEGDALYALPQSYDSLPRTPEVRCEAHKRYVDVQYVASGEEAIGWIQVAGLRTTVPYDEAKDAWFGTASLEAVTPVRLGPGQLAVLYPDDGHAPKMAIGAPSRVIKIVLKVRLGS